MTNNRNLKLINENKYKGLPLLNKTAPYVQQYLDGTIQAIESALDEHSRLFAFRFELKFPVNQMWQKRYPDNIYVQDFWVRLKAIIKYDRARAAKQYGQAHQTSVKYVWTKEYSRNGVPHYHCLILLNMDAYRSIGNINSDQPNMMSRIIDAWGRSLGLSWEDTLGLVHIPRNASYRLKRGDEKEKGFNKLVERASYLCKLDTKEYGDGQHAFGASH